MAAQHYSQYFNIDEKYYAVVTKDLIDKGEVKWEGFFPHETFIQLLHQTVDMPSGKENSVFFAKLLKPCISIELNSICVTLPFQSLILNYPNPPSALLCSKNREFQDM